MKDFDLRKYLADNRLLKEATIKVGDKVDVKPGVIDDFPSDQYVYNVNVEKINGDKLTVKDANDDEYDVKISDVEKLNENKLIKEEVYAEMEDDLSEVTVYGFGQQFTGVETNDGKYYFIHYFDDVGGDDSVPFLFDHLKKMGGKMEIDEEEITIEISYENLRPMMGIENPKSDEEDDSLDSPAAGNIEATYSKPGGPVFKSYSDFEDYYK